MPVREHTYPGPSALWYRVASSFPRQFYLPSVSTGSPLTAGWVVSGCQTISLKWVSSRGLRHSKQVLYRYATRWSWNSNRKYIFHSLISARIQQRFHDIFLVYKTNYQTRHFVRVVVSKSFVAFNCHLLYMQSLFCYRKYPCVKVRKKLTKCRYLLILLVAIVCSSQSHYMYTSIDPKSHKRMIQWQYLYIHRRAITFNVYDDVHPNRQLFMIHFSLLHV